MRDIAAPASHKSWLWKKILRVFWRVIAFLPDEPFVKLKYLSLSGRFPNLYNPRPFTEKLQVRKLHDRNPLFGTMVDKHGAKALIAERAGPQYVIDTYWAGRDPREVDWSTIPLPAVVKPTHGSGTGVFLHDRAGIDAFLDSNIASRWLSDTHHQINREWAYSQVDPQIIVERMLVDSSDAPDDYRFFVFSGKIALIELRLRRNGIVYESYFTASWTRIPVATGYYPEYPGEVPRPAKLDEMFCVARKLAGDIDFMRVDLYCPGDKVFVGELTLYPGGGFAGASPDEFEKTLGDLLQLDCAPPTVRSLDVPSMVGVLAAE